MTPKITLLCSAFLILMSGHYVYPQDRTADIDKIFNWATPTTPGCVCAISQNGKVILNRAYGSADLEHNIPMTDAAVFDIGSTRKQFVAAAILLLAEDKRLALSDDVRKYIPELPDYGRKITIDQMLTHTSGLRDWTGLKPLASGDPDAMTLILRQRGLNFNPGEEWSYSNSGYVLLTEIVARVSRMPFSEFAKKRLFDPLGMKNTVYQDNLKDDIKNRALGYEKAGSQWKVNMKLGNDRGGAGALLSTAADLLIWNDALSSGKLGAAVTAKLHEPAQLSNGRKLNYGRGLELDQFRGAKMVSHSGGAGGYHAWLGRLPEQGLSIAILCNSDAVGTTALAQRMMSLYVPQGPQAGEEGAPPAAAGEDLADINRNAGIFINKETGDQIRLAVDRDRFRVAGGPGLLPIAKNRYRRWGTAVWFMSQDKFELNFLSPDEFELKSMDGKVSKYQRALAYAPAAADLQAFAGRYQSDEMGAVLEITAEGNILKGRPNQQQQNFELKPYAPDSFQLGGISMQFIRDKAGKVTGLDFSNPLVKGIRFAKSIEN